MLVFSPRRSTFCRPKTSEQWGIVENFGSKTGFAKVGLLFAKTGYGSFVVFFAVLSRKFVNLRGLESQLWIFESKP
jgi:hypothetical protein